MVITLTGANGFAIRRALDALVADFVGRAGVHGLERVSGDGVEPGRLAELLTGASLFASERMVVLTDAAGNKALWEALADWVERVPDEMTLVIVEPVLDKRTKTYKLLVKGDLRVFDDLSERELVAWAQGVAKEAGSAIDAKVAGYLVAQAGTDQWRLWQELQKLAGDEVITKEMIDELVEPSPQASAFELLDAVLGRNVSTARRLLGHLMDSEDPYKLFGLLVSQVQTLAVVKSAGSRAADAIAKEAGMHPFVVRKMQGLARSMSREELGAVIASVAQCDDHMKSTGVDPWVLLGQCLDKIATRQ